MLKKGKLLKLAVTLILCGYVLLVFKTFNIPKPSPGEPTFLYSNQCQQDLRLIIFQALRNAKKSIFIVMFGLGDKTVIDILQTKIKERCQVDVYYDKKANPLLTLDKESLHPIQKNGLMHQKIIIIDDEMVFMGSANLTSSSLAMHDNLVIGLHNRDLAKFLKSKAPLKPGFYQGMTGGQQIEVWLLPDKRYKALSHLRSLIRGARTKIQIAMFTFTHPVLVEELIKAKKRNVQIDIALDYKSAMGASSGVIKRLKTAGINIFFNQGPELLHHKYMCIDSRHLILGSANWTKSAFTKNQDCFLVLYNLTQSQKDFMDKLNRIIELEKNE